MNTRKDSIVSSVPIYGTLLVVFCMVLMTLSEPLMAWVWVLCACTICIALMRLKKRLPSVKNLTLNLLAIFCMALLIYLSGNFGLMSTMVNLLVVAACLKLINLQTRADYHLVMIVIFFLIACGFLYHQSIYLVAYYFACLVILFASAFILNRGSLDLPSSIKQSGKMMLQALPITLILFVVVPRLPPFWQSSVEKSTQTGLSEQITPGDIANLAQSDELVFRAEFDSALPSPQQRYWRSIVLDYFDGKTWAVSKTKALESVRANTKNTSELAPNEFRYLMLTQPNNTRWLYSLDVPQIEETISSQALHMSRQYQIFQAQVTEQPSMYILRSNPDAKVDNFIPEKDFARYLQVPNQANERTQKWVDDNVLSNMSFEEKLSTMNRFFLERDFTYTLKPPLMQSSPVDQFLFEYQQGFCSHYASALTYMLRLANIPARMVAGYQGGQAQSEKIISVHQFDAHAWVEAYHPEQGWQRFDPTALVAPDRALSGLMSALNEQETMLFDDGIASWFDIPALAGLQNGLAVLDHNWNQFILDFNKDSQTNLIEKVFGELSPKNLTTFLFSTLAVIALFVALLFLPYKRWLVKQTKTPLQKLLILLSKHHFEKQKRESLSHFHNRIRDKLSPTANTILDKFVSQYYQLTYQAPSTDQAQPQDKTLEQLYLQIKKEKQLLVG